jgi:hypothetical protein
LLLTIPVESFSIVTLPLTNIAVKCRGALPTGLPRPYRCPTREDKSHRATLADRFFTNPIKTGPEKRPRTRRKSSFGAERVNWAGFRIKVRNSLSRKGRSVCREVHLATGRALASMQ